MLFFAGRAYVVPEDVRALAPDVLRHRIVLTFEAEAEDVTSDDVVTKVLGALPAGAVIRPPCRPIPPEILKQVKGIELRTRGLVGSLFAGEYRSVFRGQGMEFAEVRAYEAGDDFRAIDWNVSARLGSPYVKTFTEERELTLMLLVDQSGSTRFGEPLTKASLAIEVAAVLALAAARQNDRVGALLFADEVERVIPPRKGRRHALRVIRDLVAFEPAGRRTNLAASLSYASRLLRHRSIVVVLSDFIAEGWEKPLRRLAARHEVVAITVDDPREHELPESGWIEMQDAETGGGCWSTPGAGTSAPA